MRRRLIAASIFVAACASAGPPPGGPEDRTPPRLIRVTPDTNAVNVRDRNATFYFDEQINDRATGEGDISNFFLVSPNDGTPRISWHRSRIEVRPRHDFRENTAYTITLLPGLSDLRNNRMKQGAVVTFSTGPTIPALRIKGYAFDWVAERPQPDALVEALTRDSIRYLAQADSQGSFTVGPLPPGTYLVRGTNDQNHNRQQDRTEPWDTVRVVAPQTGPLELLIAPRDTLPARIQGVAVNDSVSLAVTFDRLLDPSQPFPATNFQLIGIDSVGIPIAGTRTPHEEKERQATLQRQAADSARRADSLARRPLTPLPRPQPADTGANRAPSRPGPFTTLIVTLTRPLKPNTTYLLRVRTVRALSGRVTSSERRFSTPKPPPPLPPRVNADTIPVRAPQGAPPPTRPPVVPPTTPPTTPPNRGP
ncbi:MAG TPA: Ig-like domain-containing protein [Gemmatimonadaceae bacterium]